MDQNKFCVCEHEKANHMSDRGRCADCLCLFYQKAALACDMADCEEWALVSHPTIKWYCLNHTGRLRLGVIHDDSIV